VATGEFGVDSLVLKLIYIGKTSFWNVEEASTWLMTFSSVSQAKLFFFCSKPPFIVKINRFSSI